MDYVVEKEKQVPVTANVDVIVVGGGVSGIFAALAAAGSGAETLIIDRFGTLGGNMGPGVIVGGSLYDEADTTIRNGLVSIPKEFMERVVSIRGNSIQNYPNISNIVSYVAAKMMEENGAKVLLSTYVSDPIVCDDRICGVFIENNSGRQAVKAKVVIDATGEAVLAKRSGAPVISNVKVKPDWDASILAQPVCMDETYLFCNDVGLFFWIEGIKWKEFNEYKEGYHLTEEDAQWVKETLEDNPERFSDFLIPILRKVWNMGEHDIVSELIRPELGNRIRVSAFPLNQNEKFPENMGNRTAFIGEIDSGDGMQVSELEDKTRRYIFDSVSFYRKYVPGFENAYLLYIAPYLGSRGGPFIEGEYTITIEDLKDGSKFDDVLYVYYLEASLNRGDPGGCDIPYRILLPRKINGMLVVGTGAAYIRRGHNPCLRARPNLYLLGHAAGTAAAMAVKNNVTPADLDVKELQRALIKDGFYLGDEKRLKSLDLSKVI